jgi:hypothetical protein
MAESGPLAALVRRVLAPGIFLLDVSRREEAAEALREAGVDIVALPEAEPYVTEARLSAEAPAPGKTPGKTPAEPSRILFPELFPPDNAASSGKRETPETRISAEPQVLLKSYDEEKAERLKEQFRARLESEGKSYGKEERAELLARIERRLVVSESQLQGISIRYEKLEARSLDYAGKTAIARQAIAQGALLEAAWPAGGNQETVLGTPENLEKKGGETILVIRPRSGRTEPVRIPLGKISVLRRIKQSIFGE